VSSAAAAVIEVGEIMTNGKASFGNPAGREPEALTPADEPATRDTFLERVVQETVVNQQSLGDDDLRALQAVAARYPDSRLTIDPIGIELVGSILRRRLPADAVDSSDTMAAAIAQSLFESPDTCEHLHSLWQQLCESVK
jgi:hypothetical protein